jgi:hypothetical protein
MWYIFHILALFVENKQHFMVEFLKWLGENKWYKYKDGRWYTLKETPYIQGFSRKFYTEEEIVQIFSIITSKS